MPLMRLQIVAQGFVTAFALEGERCLHFGKPSVQQLSDRHHLRDLDRVVLRQYAERGQILRYLDARLDIGWKVDGILREEIATLSGFGVHDPAIDVLDRGVSASCVCRTQFAASPHRLESALRRIERGNVQERRQSEDGNAEGSEAIEGHRGSARQRVRRAGRPHSCRTNLTSPREVPYTNSICRLTLADPMFPQYGHQAFPRRIRGFSHGFSHDSRSRQR